MTRTYRNDPYWLTTKFGGPCSKCRMTIERNERVFYYPKTRAIYCKQCSGQASADFYALAVDESAYNGQ